MKTIEEMYEQINVANNSINEGGNLGMSYEEGVKATLEWILEQTLEKPMDE